VVRWRTKLERVVKLQKGLLLLDQADLPDFALRNDATAGLAKYRDDVGSDGEDVKRWQEKLDAARDEIAIEREALGELDKATVVTVAMADRLDPLLQKFAKLVDAAKDDDVVRWQGKLDQGKSRTGLLRAGLAVLDDPKSVLSEAVLARLDGDLASLKAIVGEQDPGVRGWSAKLAAGRENINRLRKNLGRLDGVEWATTSLQAALSADLKTFATLVDANDPDLKKWTRKIEDSLARLKSLRTSLARLDQPANLTIDEQKVAGDQLSAFRALVSPDDGQLQAWSARMRAEASNLGTLQDELKRLDRPERMTVIELDATTKALTALVALGGIPETQRVVAEHRLQEERRKLNELREYLHSHQLGDLVDQELADNLTMLAHLAGEQDVDVKHWRTRVDEYSRLRTALQPLDAAASPPEHADQLLKDFALIVGKQSIEVRRWAAKLERIATLRQALAPLERQAPLPENAAASVAALIVEVGEKDPEAKRWAAKVARVGSLFSALDGELMGAYVLPSASPKQSNELVELIGLGDEHAAGLATRVAVLAGPGKPAWAAEYGRDEYGPFADLTIKGVTQRFRYVPSGTYVMGSPEDEPGRDKDETRVRVTLTHSFWMADSECTQGFWQQVAGRDNSRFTGLERPVERVSWEDCKAFCITLSKEVPGLRARLPTEAEWEYACRAGVEGPYPGAQGEIAGDKLDILAWFDKDSTVSWFGKDLRSTHVVKGKGSNRIGLCDMLGNVWEWCEDRYGSYSPTAVTDPIGNEQETRVARGGSFGDSAAKVRAANRLAVRQDMRTLYLGMRLVLAVDWPPGQEPRAASAAASEVPVVAPRAQISASSVPAATGSSAPVPPAARPVVQAPAPAPAPAAPAAKAPAPPIAAPPATTPAASAASTKAPAGQAAPAVPAKVTP
jgi:sulfatase modifying factor 1